MGPKQKHFAELIFAIVVTLLVLINTGNLDTQGMWARQGFGHVGHVGTSKFWARQYFGHVGHVGTQGTQGTWARQNFGHVGHVGTSSFWVRRERGHVGFWARQARRARWTRYLAHSGNIGAFNDKHKRNYKVIMYRKCSIYRPGRVSNILPFNESANSRGALK